MRPDLTVLSDCVVDIYFRVKRFPAAGEALLGELVGFDVGGACTVAVAASRLGLKVNVVDTVGDDLFASFLLERLRSFGVTTNIRRARGKHTSVVAVLLGPGNQHTYVGNPGPSLRIGRSTLLPLLGRTLFLDGYATLKMGPGSKRALLAALREARQKGLRVFFDPGPVVDKIEGLRDLVALCDVVFVNEEESHMLSSAMGTDLGRLSGKTIFVVKCGPKGAKLVWRGKTQMCPTVRARGHSVGAGDVFDAAYLWATIRGLDPELCCFVANSAARLKLRALGCAGIPTAQQVVSNLKTTGHRVPPQLEEK